MAPVVQFTLLHNIVVAPAISLPLAMTGNGLPIDVQLSAPPAQEHLLPQLTMQFEAERRWAARMPPLHVSA